MVGKIINSSYKLFEYLLFLLNFRANAMVASMSEVCMTILCC